MGYDPFCEIFHVFICRYLYLMDREEKRLFKRLTPARRNKRSLAATIGILIVVVLLMNYLINIARTG